MRNIHTFIHIHTNIHTNNINSSFNHIGINRTNICDSWIGNEGHFAIISSINPIYKVNRNIYNTFISSGDYVMYVMKCFCVYVYVYTHLLSLMSFIPFLPNKLTVNYTHNYAHNERQ